LTAPPGKWQVVKAFGDASKKGHIGNFEGQGWGNHVRLKNTQTGEIIGFNHMNDVNVQPGQTIDGGIPVGESGMSGNATGPHVAFTYQNPQGKAADFSQSPYMNYLYQGIDAASQVAQGIGNVMGGSVGGAIGSLGQGIGQMFSQPQRQPQQRPPVMFSPISPVAPIDYSQMAQNTPQQQPFQIYGSRPI